MRHSLLWKLVLAFMLIALTTAALLALFIQLTSADKLRQLIIDQQSRTLQESLATYYSEHGSWDELVNDWSQIRAQAIPTTIQPTADRPPAFGNPNPDRGPNNNFGFADAQGKVIISVDPNYPSGASVPSNVLQAGIPVSVKGKQVGTILTVSWRPALNPEENQFLRRTSEALVFATIGALVMALIVGIVLARTLTRPLQALTQAAQNITEGQLDQQVKVSSRDEIGQLASAFNSMSQEVATVNRLRRQMTADIAHDLRTPLTVIAGYVESMRDGILQPTPERLSLIYTEIERLQNLVGDLRMLSQADAGELSLNPQLLSPKNLLERAAALFQYNAGQNNVTLQVKTDDPLPEIKADEARMMQILGNLLGNALHYTPAGGKIILAARTYENKVEIAIQDNGSGIDPEDLPHIFERFYRADRSRHSELGESGLGLAIVKALVEAHDGTVSAESKPGEGTSIRILFPV